MHIQNKGLLFLQNQVILTFESLQDLFGFGVFSLFIKANYTKYWPMETLPTRVAYQNQL